MRVVAAWIGFALLVTVSSALRCYTEDDARLLLLRGCLEELECREYNFLPHGDASTLLEVMRSEAAQKFLEKASERGMILGAGQRTFMAHEHDLMYAKWNAVFVQYMPRLEWGDPTTDEVASGDVRVWDCNGIALGEAHSFPMPLLAELAAIVDAVTDYRRLAVAQIQCSDENERAVPIDGELHCICLEGKTCTQDRDIFIFLLIAALVIVGLAIVIIALIASQNELLTALRNLPPPLTKSTATAAAVAST